MPANKMRCGVAYADGKWVTDTLDTIIEEALAIYFGHRRWKPCHLKGRFDMKDEISEVNGLQKKVVTMDGKTIAVIFDPIEMDLPGEGGCRWQISYQILTSADRSK